MSSGPRGQVAHKGHFVVSEPLAAPSSEAMFLLPAPHCQSGSSLIFLIKRPYHTRPPVPNSPLGGEHEMPTGMSSSGEEGELTGPG